MDKSHFAPKRTPELVAKAKKLRAGGATWDMTAHLMGLTHSTVRRWLDPVWAEKRKAQINRNRRARESA